MLALLPLLAFSLPIYLNRAHPLADRVDDLLSQLTLEEKIGQLQQIDGRNNLESAYRSQWPGSVLSIILNASALALRLGGESRLKIPPIIGIDAIHGHGFFPGATVFPIQLGMAATWDSEIIESMGNITAFEMRYTGVHWTFAPVLCIARDQRWGRVGETFGEDPLLIGRFANAMIRGLQGPNGVTNNPDKVLACAKHFAGYSETEGGKDASESDLSERKLRSWFLPAFEKAVGSKVGSYMVSYQSIEGVPATANRWLLRDVLRGEWGFKGFLVTDYNNVGSMVDNQLVAANFEEAATLAVNAGNDMIMATPDFFNGALAAAKSGKLNVTLIDDSVRRILEAKVKLGLFEDPRAPDEAKARARAGSPASRAQAQRAAEESLILLKNDGTLPVQPEQYQKIAVIGPNADHPVAQNSDWSLGSGHTTMFSQHPRSATITVLDGVKARFAGQVVYEKGVALEANETANLTAAVAAARVSGLTIVVVGDRMPWVGERKSTSSLNLVGGQLELLNAVAHLGVPFIVSVIASKPLVIPQNIIDAAAAIVWQFSPGMLGGRAFARAVFGDYNPSGRLPISIPRHTGQVPLYYQEVRGQHQRGHADLPAGAQWGFGYGLTYSDVQYFSATLSKKTYTVHENITVTVRVVNWSPLEVVEVVQVYVADMVTSATWAAHELKGFARVKIAAEGSLQIAISVPAADCSIVTSDAKRVVEPGSFELRVGKSSDDIKLTVPFSIQ